MRDQDSLLADAKRAVVQWGGHLNRTYSDNHGQYGIRITYRGETFIAVAKQTAHKNRASFAQRVVKRADSQDVLLCEFFGEDPTLGSVYVFRPETVLEEGRESHGTSKKGTPTDWYELGLDHGCTLGDYVTGREVPAKPSEKSTRPVAITDYA